MNVAFEINLLETSDDWKRLSDVLGGPSEVVTSVIRHLMLSHVKSYLLESHYIDRDYSSDYRFFYAQTFRAYDRHCKRIHFFAEDVGKLLDLPSWSDRVRALEETSERSYCGFCVIRPLPRATIGRSALKMRGPEGANLESATTCRATVRANLMGAKLRVTGACFVQQDSRVGACAQASIWMGARHMHLRYGYNWLSVADITKLAAPTTPDEATSLPAGSDFLTSERMIRAVYEMGFQALCFRGPNIGEQILPYVDSGLPVILGLNIPNSTIGHAVTVVGRVFSKIANPTSRPIDYVAGLLVHDDQAGPYKVIPSTATSASEFGIDKEDTVHITTQAGTTTFNIIDNGVFALALMPLRAFSTSRFAEITAVGRFNKAMQGIDALKAEIAKGGVANTLLDDLIAAYKNNNIIFRTYLTSAEGYRRHIANGTACEALKDELLRLHLPHFTWVTEFSTTESYNNSSSRLRRIFGHSVIDATSSGRDAAGLLVLHLPGVLFMRDVNEREDGKAERAIVIANDSLYECREKRPSFEASR